MTRSDARRLVWLAVVLLAASCGAGRQARVIVAAGTTIVDSGFAREVLVVYEDTTGVEVSIVGGSSAEVLELLAQGAAAAGISHAPGLEDAYLGEHPDSVSEPVFTSRFVLVGPSDVVAPVAGLDPASALGELWASGAVFVSRDDGSGTHATELELWAAAGVTPDGPRYVKTGQGMGFTLQVADQRSAVTLSEIGAYLEAAPNLTLVIADTAPSPVLDNPYQATAPLGGTGEDVVRWLRSDDGRRAIVAANERLFGEIVYAP